MAEVAGAGELESARVARVLRDDIIYGRRAPGSRLVERDLATELNVSRLPVREAIRALVSEGIVTSRPRSWAVVRRFTPRDIQDLAEVREAIETLMFVFAAQRHDSAGLARLRAVCTREFDAAVAGDHDAARAAASDFHTIVGELADNDMLSEVLSVFVTRLRWLFGQQDDLLERAEQHRVLLDALADRDVERVRSLIPEHMALGQETAARQLAHDDVAS